MTDPRPVETPWMRIPDAQAYARAGRTAILTALESGELRGYQRGPGARWRIHRDDLDAWLRGEPPVSAPERITRRREP